jgi:hypothetical protein
MPATTSGSALARSLHEALLSARNDDGGWGYAEGKRSRLEPTAVALLALDLAGELIRVVERWQQKAAVIIEPGADTANYAANAQAALVALSTRTVPAAWVLRLIESLAAVEGRKTPPGDPAISRQDNALRGWPWVGDTFSWAEPTAWCLLALKRASHHVPAAHARIDEGERLLIDRVCEPGGWNYGNSNVFRRNLPAYTPTTAIALLAMQGRDVPAVTRSLAFLKEHRLREKSGLALALTAICLGVYRQLAKDVLDALAYQWSRTRYLGNMYATALALYAVTRADSGFEAFRV